VEIPFGMMLETTIGANNDLIAYEGQIYVYGIVEVYYGRRSAILNLIPAQYRDFKICGKEGAYVDSTIYRGTFSNAVPEIA
jgi:hypothetical protein